MKAMIPPDLSPAQRAQVKSLRALAIIVVLNVGFTVGQFIFSAFMGGQAINWGMLGLFAFGSFVYGVLDVGEKYFSAKRQPLLSEIFELGKQEGMRVAKINVTADSALQRFTTQAVQECVDEEKQNRPGD
ncbi:MAG TPA: hypothetical protein VHL10_00740 [Nitrososphaera sp.]|jgi:hypothetical protein|nr:hypothetical protein [Nitrososphaera sp.]